METDDAAVPALPDDVLAAILGRLLARSLAASRCVCKAWRDLVDERGLLEQFRRVLPHSVSGIFANYDDHGRPHFFARPTPSSSSSPAAATIDGKFSYVLPERRRHGWYKVVDHCNGLVLYRNERNGDDLYVCNPATWRWVRLPEHAAAVQPAMWPRRAFLVFSPAVSRHYQVLVAPLHLVPEEEQRFLDVGHPAGDAEWPPSRWTWHVFSSRTGRWRERVFVRQGEAAGIAADLRMDSLPYSPNNPRWRYAVHRQGALYVHCRGEYVARLSLSAGDYSYHVIKSPIDRSEHYKKVKTSLGKSKGEVYFVAINKRRLRVWMLNDYDSQRRDPIMAGSEWILKHDRVLWPNDWWDMVQDRCYHKIQCEDGPWILDDYYKKIKDDRRKLDWSSDGDDDVICRNADREEDDDDDERYVYPESFHFVGFHPYKEVIFLTTLDLVVAYHLSTSKVQFLGILKPAEWNYGMFDSFVYTPCYDLRHRG